MWESFDFGPAPVSVKVDRALTKIGLDPRSLDNVGILSRHIPTDRHTGIEMQLRATEINNKRQK